jgi:surface polysaccharide O-acyltransferase-like enzyme
LLGGVGRVAVPLFALAAGLFYFASCDGTIANHVAKLRSRVFTLLVPYLIIGGVAVGAQLAMRFIERDPIGHSAHELVFTWWFRPPAEQLWFLRDLIVLSALAPAIGWLLQRAPFAFVASVALLWFNNVQPFPIVEGWYSIHTETLLFYSIGAVVAKRPEWMERLINTSRANAVTLTVLWIGLVTLRVWVQPNFDAWYVREYTQTALWTHQTAILFGLAACFAWAGRTSSPAWSKLSGLAFFVYLVHEFPLRAVVERFAATTSLGENSFWITAPVVVSVCFLSGRLVCEIAPTLFQVISGGRTPMRALQIRSGSASRSTTASAAQ